MAEQVLTPDEKAEMASLMAGLERQQQLADDLADKMPGTDSITRYVIAGDLLSAERSMERLQSGEWEWEQALYLTGSYARLNLAIETVERGYGSRDQLLAMLPELWRGSDPDDTDPRYLRLWIEAFNRNGRATVRDGRPLPAGSMLPVFRGQMPGAQYGIAWTLDPKIAQKFARSLGGRSHADQGGVVYRGFVHRRNVLAYLTGRRESEVVVNPADIQAIR